MADPLTSPKLLIATTNASKLAELMSLLAECPFELVSLADVGIETDVEETGATFEENASLKASAYARMSGLPSLADDSGLEVEALGGEPGVRSARFAGPGATDAQLVAYLLRKLDNVSEERMNARFRCVIAVAWPEGTVDLHTGQCRGRIIRTPRGKNGFGYDPVFLLPELGKTTAELTPEQKNRVSHRGRAAKKAVEALRAAADRASGRSDGGGTIVPCHPR